MQGVHSGAGRSESPLIDRRRARSYHAPKSGTLPSSPNEAGAATEIENWKNYLAQCIEEIREVREVSRDRMTVEAPDAKKGMAAGFGSIVSGLARNEEGDAIPPPDPGSARWSEGAGAPRLEGGLASMAGLGVDRHAAAVAAG
eukprot:tig00000655_g2893.t1